VTRFPGGYFRVTDGALELAIEPTAVPLVMRFAGESLAALKQACLKAFWGRVERKRAAND
jgi:hypothetical protein